MHKKLFLDIDYEQFIKADLDDASSCITHQVYELTDIHKRYGGFPKTYRLENTTIHQKFWTANECDYDKLGKLTGIDVVTVSSIKQPPGNTIPLHRDTFYQIKKKYPERTGTVVRANIFLQDWKLGHFLQYDDVVHTHWKAGEGHMWDSEVLHIGANNGMEDKYTLQISGFLL